jgi:heat shock protein HtpX
VRRSRESSDGVQDVTPEEFNAMTTSARHFTTNARAWLLVAALTALLIGVGALVGGMFFYAFVALAVGVNVVGYWFSDRIALRASGAQRIEPGTNLELEAMVQDLAARAQVPVPRLYMIHSEQPNAFATGRNPAHAAVAVTDGLLQQLPPEQVKSVLAHEFAHIKNRDILVSSFAALIAGAIAAIANLFHFSLLFGGEYEDSGPLGWIGAIGTIIFAPLAASLLQLGVSRQREYLADATGAELIGRATPLADALETLELRAQSVPHDVNPATASLYIVNPLTRHGIATLSPPTLRSPSGYAGSERSTESRRFAWLPRPMSQIRSHPDRIELTELPDERAGCADSH